MEHASLILLPYYVQGFNNGIAEFLDKKNQHHCMLVMERRVVCALR